MLHSEKLGCAWLDPEVDMMNPGLQATGSDSSSWLAPRLCPTSCAKVIADSERLAGICSGIYLLETSLQTVMTLLQLQEGAMVED